MVWLKKVENYKKLSIKSNFWSCKFITKKVEAYKFKKKLKLYIKIEKIITTFGDIEIKKQKFYQHNRPISIKNIDINKLVVSNKVSLIKKGFKYFIGYKNAKKNKPLWVFLPEMSVYRRSFDKTKYMFLYTKDDELFEKYKEIWENVKNSIKKNLIMNLYTKKNT